MSEKARILCVDDESNVLNGLRRQLRREFELETAEGSAAGLRAAEAGDFAVVVSDLRMPGMDGIELLCRVRQCAPDTTRILLTGNADLSAAAKAINEGSIFRFLTKPCQRSVLVAAIQAGVEQHRLVTAERVLLERTLHGTVKMLTEVLALANPSAFGRANRIKQQAGVVARFLGEPEPWKMELAAMLSQVAWITLPGEALEHLQQGQPPTAEEQAMLERLPEVGQKLLADIPRLEDVRAILRYQTKCFDGQGPPADACSGERIPIGARILKAVVDLDACEARDVPRDAALESLRGRAGAYDPGVLAALEATPEDAGAEGIAQELMVDELRSGMVLMEPVESLDGRLLVARGQEVSVGLLERLHNFASNVGVKEPLRVHVKSPPH